MLDQIPFAAALIGFFSTILASFLAGFASNLGKSTATSVESPAKKSLRFVWKNKFYILGIATLVGLIVATFVSLIRIDDYHARLLRLEAQPTIIAEKNISACSPVNVNISNLSRNWKNYEYNALLGAFRFETTGIFGNDDDNNSFRYIQLLHSLSEDGILTISLDVSVNLNAGNPDQHVADCEDGLKVSNGNSATIFVVATPTGVD